MFKRDPARRDYRAAMSERHSYGHGYTPVRSWHLAMASALQMSAFGGKRTLSFAEFRFRGRYWV
jgi:hypothetical protein